MARVRQHDPAPASPPLVVGRDVVAGDAGTAAAMKEAGVKEGDVIQIGKPIAEDLAKSVAGIFAGFGGGPLPSKGEKGGVSLEQVLVDADKASKREVAQQVVFGSVNAATESPIDARFPALVERAQAPLVWTEILDEYEAWLQLGDRRTDEAFIRKAHEQGPSIIRKVADLFFQAKRALETWEAENDVVFGSMREQASEALEEEKARGARKKTITEADVKAKAATLFPDEWPRQVSKRRDHAAVVKRAEHDLEVSKIRQKTLDGMIARLH